MDDVEKALFFALNIKNRNISQTYILEKKFICLNFSMVKEEFSFIFKKNRSMSDLFQYNKTILNKQKNINSAFDIYHQILVLVETIYLSLICWKELNQSIVKLI